MALDFYSYFTLSYNQYLNNQLLTSEAFDELFLLDKIFDKHSGDNNPDFWDDSLLEVNKDWNIVRQKAKHVLSLMKMDNLDIECIHQDIIEGGKTIGQQTKTRLIKKPDRFLY